MLLVQVLGLFSGAFIYLSFHEAQGHRISAEAM